ncbi:MAG: LysM peptidoglycan-binding domain-containing protein [Acidimicrobiales bacterium]
MYSHRCSTRSVPARPRSAAVPVLAAPAGRARRSGRAPIRVGVALLAAAALAGCGRTAPDGAFPASGTDPNVAGVQITSPDAVITVPGAAASEPASTPDPSEPTDAGATSVPAGPDAAAPPSTAAADSGTRYTVADGDTLWGLSNRFGISVEALASANGLSDVDTLKPGQELVIPSVEAVDVEVTDESG